VSDHPIRFRFDAKKAAQAANKLLRLSGGERNYMELVKLLYLADREALLRLDQPITGDSFVALPHGPALGHILDLIRWGPVDEADAPWFAAVSPPFGYSLRALPACGEDELSDAEDQILTEIFEKFGKLSWKELSRWTHALPEWVNPAGDRMPIPAEQILLLEGKSRDEIERIGCEVAAYERLDLESEYYRKETASSAIPKAEASDSTKSENHPNQAGLPANRPDLDPIQPMGSLKDYLREQEMNYVNRALALAGGDKEKAAQLLNVSVATLYRKLAGEEVEA